MTSCLNRCRFARSFRTPRLADRCDPLVPWSRISLSQNRAFAAMGPTLWNDTPLFTQFVLSHASNNITSRNIGGTDTWAVPHLKFWEGPSPISFRQWLLHIANEFDDRHNSGDNETWRLYCEKP